MATETLRPDAAGDETNIETQKPDSTFHWDKVDEAVADEETTYVEIDETADTWQRDFYNLPAHGGTGTVIRYITVYAHVWGQNIGFNHMKIAIKSGTGGGAADTVDESAEKVLANIDTWETFSEQWALNPATTAAWTWDEIDNLQIGVNLNSDNSQKNRCTQVYVVIDHGTPPDPPTVVAATDGAHTDKVVITWTPAAGATAYQVYRDAGALGWLGDVATYDDTGSDAPTITPGIAAASDGLYAAYIALTISGHSANIGTSHTYKVRCKNVYGESGDSGTDAGYVGVGALTYQWQRSFGDADELYTSIVGAIAATYSDVDAPERGWGRYYQCILNATGAAQQTSVENRGYRLAAVIPLLGTTRIDAKDFMAQLGDETVLAYTATTKAANTIVDELLALQYNTPAITAGTIEFTTAIDIYVPQDTILGVLMRMQEMLGGYMSVNNARELDWLIDIGSDTGQQIRYQKNLKGIRRTIDYSNFANRIYFYGAGEGEERVKLGGQVCQSQLVPGTDIAEKRIKTEEWAFTLAPSSWMVGCFDGTGGSIENKIGGGGRFLNITIPQGAIIREARLIFPDSAFSQTIVNSLISGEDADNPDAFSTLADYDSRARTGTVAWNAIPTWGGGGERISPDIASILQTIVDRAGFASEAVVIFWDDHGGNSTIKSYNVRQGSLPPVLYVVYSSTALEYIEDTVSQAQYGGIYTRTLVNKAITDSTTLDEWAGLKLLEMKDPYISYEIDLANLEAVGLSFEALALGNIVRVIDEDLDIKVTARVVKITRDLSNPINIKVEIANKVKDVIDQLGRDFRWRNEMY